VRHEVAARRGSPDDGGNHLIQRQLTEVVTHLQSNAYLLREARCWLPWKVMGAMALAVVLVTAGVNASWIRHVRRAWEREQGELQRYKTLALGLDRYLLETLYPQRGAAAGYRRHVRRSTVSIAWQPPEPGGASSALRAPVRDSGTVVPRLHAL
jgi:hypothetical protein